MKRSSYIGKAVMIAAAFVALIAVGCGGRETIISVVDYGADPTGIKDSATAVTAALRAAKDIKGPVRVVFPTGMYRLYPGPAEKRDLYLSNTVGLDERYVTKTIGILVEERDNITIDGRGSRLNYHGQQTAFAALKSNNVRFKNFSFDVVTPRLIDATVRDVGVDTTRTQNGTVSRAYRIITVPPDTNYNIVGTDIQWSGEIDPETGEPFWTGTNDMGYTQVHDPRQDLSWRAIPSWEYSALFTDVYSITGLGNDRIKIVYNYATMPDDGGLVYQMRDTMRDTAAAIFWESSSVTVDNVDAHYLQGFGYLGQLSRDITIENSAFEADPASGRNTVGFADIVQMSGVAGTVALKNNIFDAAHDDPINIHGTYMQIVAKQADDQITVRYMHPQSSGFPQFYVGDEVEFVRKSTMAAVAAGFKVAAVISTPPGNNANPVDANGVAIALDEITIKLDKPIPAEITADGLFVAENVTYTPRVVVEDNIFRNLPTRGLLVTTRQPISIQRNVFDGQGMATIYISSDAESWFESGPVRDVLIKDNIFRRPTVTAPVIFIEPTNKTLDASNPVHRNIRIENNTFEMNDVRALDAKSVQGISFTGNTLKRLDRDRLYAVSVPQACLAPGENAQAFLARIGLDQAQGQFIYRGSSDILIEGNKYDPGIRQKIDLISTPAANVTVKGEATSLDGVISAWPTTATYASSDPSVLVVSPSGALTAVKEGTAEVSATIEAEAGALNAQVATVTVSSQKCSGGNALAAPWTPLRDAVAARTATPDGALLLVPTNGFLRNAQNTARLVLNSASDGKGDAVVKITGKPAQEQSEAGLVLYGGDDEYIAVKRSMNNGLRTIIAVLERGGKADESRMVLDSEASSLWLKISVDNEWAQALYSTDGLTWTPLGSPMATRGLTAKFGVIAASAAAGHPAFRFSEYAEDGKPISFWRGPRN